MEEEFIKKWAIPAIDADISSVNESLTCPVDSAQMLKDPTDKKLEFLFKNNISLAGSVVQPALAAIGVCQSLKDQFKEVLKIIPDKQAQDLAGISETLCFTVDAMKDSILQASRLMLGLVHVRRILWLKNWSAETPCKKLLANFPFHGEWLFGDDLDNYIQIISN